MSLVFQVIDGDVRIIDQHGHELDILPDGSINVNYEGYGSKLRLEKVDNIALPLNVYTTVYEIASGSGLLHQYICYLANPRVLIKILVDGEAVIEDINLYDIGTVFKLAFGKPPQSFINNYDTKRYLIDFGRMVYNTSLSIQMQTSGSPVPSLLRSSLILITKNS